MPSGISTSCPYCGKSLKVKNSRAIGKRVPCPQCRKPFVVTSQPEFEDDFGLDESHEDDYESFDERPTRRRRPAPRRNNRSTSHRSNRKQKPNNLFMIIGGLSGMGVGLMILLGLFLGKNGGGIQEDGNAANRSQTPTQPTIALTDQECAKQAELIRKLIESNDLTGLNRQFNWTVFAATSVKGIEMPAKNRREIIASATNSRTTRVLLQRIMRPAQNSQIRVLRVVTIDGQKRARLRLVGDENGSGISYYDFVLQKRPAAGIQIVDIYFFYSGELMSETFNRSLLKIAASESRGFLEKLSDTDSSYVNSIDEIGVMMKHIQGNRPAEALQIYHSLPASVQINRSVLLLRITAASNAANNAEYTTAIELMRKHHPDNTALEFISIDYYFINKQFQKLLAVIDRLDEAVGGDPYLNVFRANAHIELEQPEEAREYLQAAIDQELSLKQVYDMALQFDIVHAQYSRAAALLNQYEEQFGKTTGEFSKLPEYAEFRQSSEYRNRKQTTPQQ